jgi:hypothetical protein
MGQFAFSSRSSFEAGASHQTRPNPPERSNTQPAQSANVADGETRRMLGLLLHAFERLPE